MKSVFIKAKVNLMFVVFFQVYIKVYINIHWVNDMSGHSGNQTYNLWNTSPCYISTELPGRSIDL